ncbi:hypothetical protein QFZ53_002431 [Microbacterium natoriense]|uniref:Uncharacterized protein n=1 Tax=Microbacterium natoriense TaxID=284570 RepID=A0AAW8EXQ6_9MICO|nr:hypothetical protein [Microbacterium natoriense]MDQ0648235.1 hypothetical protein [Microbacterium natoriense]
MRAHTRPRHWAAFTDGELEDLFPEGIAWSDSTEPPSARSVGLFIAMGTATAVAAGAVVMLAG